MSVSRRPIFAFLFAGSVILLSVLGCSAERKALKQIKAESTRATLALPAKQQREFRDMKIEQLVRDTLVIHDYNGKDVFVMNAIRDDETGEMVANEMLAAQNMAGYHNIELHNEAMAKLRESGNVMEAVKLLAERAGMSLPEDGYDDSMQKLKRPVFI